MMFKAPSTPLLLLVVALCCTIAQTRNLLATSSTNNNNTTNNNTKALVTSSDAAAAAADVVANNLRVDRKTLQAVKQNLLDLEPTSTVAVRQSSSVVQDWSLVCKQLCGAGLGGAACADVCRGVDKTLPRPHNANNMARLLNANKSFICKDLCKLRLGNAACNCAAPASQVLSDSEARNNICRSFCEHSGLTLNGCSSCTLAANDVNDNNNNDEGEEILGKTNATDITTTTTTTTTTKTASANEVAKKKQVTAHGSASSASSAANNIAVDVDVSVNFVGIKPASDAETTTPDWIEMCKILCRTGDGGSLCNCDLSPFFNI